MRRVGRWLFGGFETIVMVALAVLSFLVFTTILSVSLPRGAGLRDLYGDLIQPGQTDTRVILGGHGNEPEWIASLIETHRDVKDRPQDAMTWSDATRGMSLGQRHAIQTFEGSGAVIELQQRSRLTLGENSLVVLRRTESARRADRRAALVVLGGRVQGQVTAATGDQPAVDIAIVTAGAEAQIVPAADEPAEFSVEVQPDQSAVLKVLSGTAEVRSGDSTAVIESRHALTISSSGPLGLPQRLPDAPKLRSPSNGAELVYGAVPPEVRFDWDPGAGHDGYVLTLARDAAFEQPLLVEELTGSEFVHDNLDSGSYFWRVSGRVGETTGEPGPTYRLHLLQDLEPPLLEVSIPEATTGSELIVRGRTEPGVKVLIGHDVVATSEDGAFEYALALRPGPNVVVIEAVDAAGNAAYRSQYVYAKPVR